MVEQKDSTSQTWINSICISKRPWSFLFEVYFVLWQIGTNMFLQPGWSKKDWLASLSAGGDLSYVHTTDKSHPWPPPPKLCITDWDGSQPKGSLVGQNLKGYEDSSKIWIYSSLTTLLFRLDLLVPHIILRHTSLPRAARKLKDFYLQTFDSRHLGSCRPSIYYKIIKIPPRPRKMGLWEEQEENEKKCFPQLSVFTFFCVSAQALSV